MKINIRFKKVFRIIFQCTVVVLLIAAALYFIPRPTRVDLTLNAVKLDAQGNEIGTEQITMKGYKLDYLFRESRMDLEIDPFGTLNYVRFSGENKGQGTIYRFGKDSSGTEYLWISLYGGDSVLNDVALWDVYFTEEMDCFAFLGRHAGPEPVYYVASASGSYTTQQIVDYFNGLVP